MRKLHFFNSTVIRSFVFFLSIIFALFVAYNFFNGNAVFSGLNQSAAVASAVNVQLSTFYATPSQSLFPGRPILLQWVTSPSPATCTLTGTGIGTILNITAGQYEVNPVVDSTYTLSCGGQGGLASMTISVPVAKPAPPQLTFTASQTAITAGQSVLLKWTSNADTCTSSQFNTGGNKTDQTGVSVTPQVTTTYSMLCTRSYTATTYVDTASASVTVTVSGGGNGGGGGGGGGYTGPAISSFTATPSTIHIGDGPHFSWQSRNTSSCKIDGTTVNTNATLYLFPPSTTHTYVLTCKPAVGIVGADVSASVFVTVSGNPPPPDPGDTTVTLGLRAPHDAPNYSRLLTDPTQKVSLSWSSQNADTCTSNDFDTGGHTNSLWQISYGISDIKVHPTRPTTYTVTCNKTTGGFGFAKEIASDSATVEFSPGLIDYYRPPTITSFTSKPTLAYKGGYIELQWATTRAKSCTLNGRSVPINSSGGYFVGPVDIGLSYVLNCYGQAYLDHWVTEFATTTLHFVVQIPPVAQCKYTTITLNESRPATPANSPVSFTLVSAEATAEDLGYLVSAYDPDWGSNYILKQLRGSSALAGTYNLFSNRYLNSENFTDPLQSQIIEVPEAETTAVIPYISGASYIKIDNNPAIPVNLPTSCSPVCRLSSQTVSPTSQSCCAGLSMRSVNSNTFICSN